MKEKGGGGTTSRCLAIIRTHGPTQEHGRSRTHVMSKQGTLSGEGDCYCKTLGIATLWKFDLWRHFPRRRVGSGVWIFNLFFLVSGSLNLVACLPFHLPFPWIRFRGWLGRRPAILGRLFQLQGLLFT